MSKPHKPEDTDEQREHRKRMRDWVKTAPREAVDKRLAELIIADRVRIANREFARNKELRTRET